MNFQEKYYRWAERMQKKTPEERHNYALTVSFFLGAVVCFFVVSSWYYRLTGGDFSSSIFTDLENFYTQNKSKILEFKFWDSENTTE